MSKDNVFDKTELDKFVVKTYKEILKSELSNNGWISEKILSILRRVISRFSPNDVLKQENKILSTTFFLGFHRMMFSNKKIKYSQQPLMNILTISKRNILS